MGLILDSSVLIAAEREGKNAHQALAQIALRAAGEDVALSVVTVLELAHGAARADTPSTAKGITLPLSDLLIGVTALELGYRVATGNARHFQAIPGISVVIF